GGPDDGREPAKEGVRQGDAAEDDDRGGQVQAGDDVDGEGGDEQPAAIGEEAPHQENPGAGGVGGQVEALQQQAIDRVDLVAVKRGDEDRGQHEAGRDRTHGELQVGQVPGVALLGGSEEGCSADFGGDQREEGRPP